MDAEQNVTTGGDPEAVAEFLAVLCGGRARAHVLALEVAEILS